MKHIGMFIIGAFIIIGLFVGFGGLVLLIGFISANYGIEEQYLAWLAGFIMLGAYPIGSYLWGK